MIRKVAVVLKRYFPANVYSCLLEMYRYTKRPLLKKLILDSDSDILVKVFKRFAYPSELFVFLTTRCNIRCVICRREDHLPMDLDSINIERIIEPLRHAKIIDLTGWGEPFLYKNFKEVVGFIFTVNSRKNLLRITTNGTMLSRDYGIFLKGKLHSLVISLNAATEFTYNRDMKNSDYNKVISAIKEFISSLDCEDLSRITLHFVAHAENYKEIPEFVSLARSLGVKSVTVGNYVVSTADHINMTLLGAKGEYNDIIDSAEKRALEMGVFLQARKFISDEEAEVDVKKCFYPYTQFFIQPDGEIDGPCCFAGSYPMGNVFRDSFESVWFGEKYKRLRRKRHLPACRTCTVFGSFDSLEAHFDSAFLNKNRSLTERSLTGGQE